MRVIKGSVANHKLVQETIKKHKINVIFHLAAEAIVSRSYKDPLSTFSSNIKGSWNILDCCRDSANVEAIIIASSDKAYGSNKKLPYKEDYPLQGVHPYDVSKSCADLIANMYHHTFNLPVSITRCGNIFGPGDFNISRIVPDSMISMIRNKTLKIRSDGKFTRDYVYVDDIVNAYILLAEKLKKCKLQGEAFNFSIGRPLSVIDLVNSIYKAHDQEPNCQILGKVKYEIKHQHLSSAKAKKLLGWNPKSDLLNNLKETAQWYRNQF